MKIVAVDNFGRDTVSDILIAENVSKQWAEYLVKCLNKGYGGLNSPYYFLAKEDDYKLYKVEY